MLASAMLASSYPEKIHIARLNREYVRGINNSVTTIANTKIIFKTFSRHRNIFVQWKTVYFF